MNSNIDNSVLRAEYEAGATLLDLAFQYGTALSAIHKRLLKAGTTMRKAGCPLGLRQPDDKLKHAAFFKDKRAKGWTYDQIAEALGCTKQNVGLLAIRLGMAPRASNPTPPATP